MTEQQLPYERIRFNSDDQESMERLVALMIVNNDFLKTVAPLLSDLSILPTSGFLSIVIKWVLKYGEDNGRAPRANIQTVFNDYKKAMGEDEPNVDLIQRFLTAINGRHIRGDFNDVDLTFELNRAEKFLQSLALTQNRKAMDVQNKMGNVEEAVRLHREFQIPYLSGQPKTIFQMIDSVAIESADFLAQDIARPEYVIDPWLTDGSLTMIYAPTGIGKTWLCLIIATVVTRSNFYEQTIGPWEINNTAGVLYLDGEMQEYFVQERLKKITKRQESHPNTPMTLVSASQLGKQFRAPLNISSPQWREAIYDTIKADDRYQLLILDNLASLTPGIDENSKQEWDPINQWILSFRQLNVSVIMVHHAGKQGKQRGTSGREDPLDTIIKLYRPSRNIIPPDLDKKENTFFGINFQKARDADPVKISDFVLGIVKSSRVRGVDWMLVNTVDSESENE